MVRDGAIARRGAPLTDVDGSAPAPVLGGYRCKPLNVMIVSAGWPRAERVPCGGSHLLTTRVLRSRGGAASASRVDQRQAYGMPAAPLRVLIVDEQPVVRKGVAHMLAGMDEPVEVAEAGDVAGALRSIAGSRPDLVVTEVALPGLSGIDLVKRLLDDASDLPILVFSSQEEAVYAERTLRAGASGFISKTTGEEAFLEAVRHVLCGQVYVNPRVRQRILAGMAGARTPASLVEHLSDRELAVFELVGQGRTRSEIAGLLNLSPKTVGSYRARIKAKLNLDGAAHLVQMAVQWVRAEP